MQPISRPNRLRLALLAFALAAACAPTAPLLWGPLSDSPATAPVAGVRGADLRAAFDEALGGSPPPRVFVHFRPRHQLYPPYLLIRYQDGAETSTEGNPVVITVTPPGGTEQSTAVVRATDFVGRAFQHFNRLSLSLLNGLVRRAVAEVEAEKEGIEFTDAEITREVERVVTFLYNRANQIHQPFPEMIAERGYDSEKALREGLRLHVREVLVQEHLYWLQFTRFPKVMLKQIVLPLEGAPGERDPAKLATQIVADLRSGKLRWRDAVKQHSIDRKTRSKGGALKAPVTPAARMFNVERDVVFKLKVGRITDPIRTELGWRIYKCRSIDPGRPGARWAEVKADILLKLEGDDPNRPARLVPGNLDLRHVNMWLDYVLTHGAYAVQRFYPRIPADKVLVARLLDGDPKLASTRVLASIPAAQFVAYAFAKHPLEAKLMGARAALPTILEFESKRERLTTVPGEVLEAAAATLAHLEARAEQRGVTLEETYLAQGFADKGRFNTFVDRQVVELLKLEKLVLLHDLRHERRRLRHILLLTEREAKRALRLVREPGADFAGLARRHSQDTGTKDLGGDLGYVTPGTYAASFDRVAFALRKGAYSKPVATRQGWHIIKCEDIRRARPRATYARLADEIANEQLRRGTIPGGRLKAGDIFRWLDAVQKEHGFVVELTVPAFRATRELAADGPPQGSNSSTPDSGGESNRDD